jgi:hypothetical protein
MALELFKIELVLRKKQVDMVNVPINLLDVINEYKVIENEIRLVADFPIDWDGFKNGVIIDILKYFNESIYIGIAYLTDSNAIVTDLLGKPIEVYDETFNGLAIKKYVNKKLRITKLLDKDSDKFEIKGYMLNLKFVEPILKVLDVYSVGKDSGVNLKTFNIDLE